jgi:hypothetical protein
MQAAGIDSLRFSIRAIAKIFIKDGGTREVWIACFDDAVSDRQLELPLYFGHLARAILPKEPAG